jgi:hypothetical protein
MDILYYLFYDPIQKFNNTFERRGIPMRKTEENIGKFGQLLNELSLPIVRAYSSVKPTPIPSETTEQLIQNIESKFKEEVTGAIPGIQTYSKTQQSIKDLKRTKNDLRDLHHTITRKRRRLVGGKSRKSIKKRIHKPIKREKNKKSKKIKNKK